MQTTAWKYQVGLTTVHFIIKEVCEAIWKALSPLYLKPPNSEEDNNNNNNTFISIRNLNTKNKKKIKSNASIQNEKIYNK
jgi:hypothetical protein